MLISIIIPCYRSEKTIGTVVKKIKEEFAKHTEYEYQIILVNDGSPDNVWEVISHLCNEDKKVIGVNLSNNFGQASAKLAALDLVEGEILVYMDDDGQHPESGIFQLVEKIRDGNDVVYAHFPQKKHTGFKKITSVLHRKVAEITGNKPKGIFVSSFTAWSRLCIDAVRKYRSPFPSAGSYLYNVTSKIANVKMEHKDRIEGTSGYTLKKLIALWMTSFTNFSIIPLRFSSFIGAFCAIAGFAFGAFAIIRKFILPEISAGYTSTVAIILFVGGIIMMMLGLIGEYIGRIYMTLSDMPQYKIREILNAKEKNDGC